MSRFTCREFQNIESELDLWARYERESGRSDRQILEDLIYSMDALLSEHEDEVLDDVPDREMDAYDRGFWDGKQFERRRLAPKIMGLRNSIPLVEQ